jgi:hypothetical protein
MLMLSNLFSILYSKITKNNKWLFAVLFCTITVINLPAYKAGFNGDFEGLLGYYHHYGIWDFVNSKDFNVKSSYQITHIQLFTFISLFGIHPIPWFLLQTSLHAVNGVLIFYFCKKIFSDFSIPNGTNIALVGTLLFIVNPNITEITIWKGGYHYLPGLLFQLMLLIWAQAFMKTGDKKYLYYSPILFFISTFSLEIFYLTPWLCLILMVGYYWKNLIDQKTFQTTIKLLFVPQILLFCIHLIYFRLRFGSWIAHYGTTGELFFNLKDFLPKLPKYLATLIGFSAQLPHEKAKHIYTFLNIPIVYFSFYGIIFIVVVLIFIRFKKMSSNLQASAILLCMSLLCVSIISPIYFDEMMQVYNSRRCYELSFPLYMLFSIIVFSLFRNPKYTYIFFSSYLTVFSALGIRKALDWRRADKIQRGILNNYKWQKNKQIIILNMPTYYKDIRIIPINKQNEFEENLLVFGHDTTIKPIQYVSSYNMINIWDGAHVNMLDSTTLKVTLNQWGSWWMYNFCGATDTENEVYRLEMKDVGHEYILHLKQPSKDWIILYQQGEQWHIVNTKKSTNEEQW